LKIAKAPTARPEAVERVRRQASLKINADVTKSVHADQMTLRMTLSNPHQKRIIADATEWQARLEHLAEIQRELLNSATKVGKRTTPAPLSRRGSSDFS
jgi:hypothetical protein